MNKHLRYWSISTTIAFALLFILNLKNNIFFVWDIFVAISIGSLIYILVKIFKEEEKKQLVK
ncbi:MAG: hypothetical protein RIN55_09785 [Tissierellaceae bacterium]|nr:hypothetical protein [Tissierellaceae bacterium]